MAGCGSTFPSDRYTFGAMSDHDKHHNHAHGHQHAATGHTLGFALLLTLGFAVLELVAGWRSGSLALIADAGHMFTDGAALGLSALAAWLASRPPSPRHSYGLGKAELLAALINACAMLAVVFGIGIEAWQRLRSPGAVDGVTVGVVAAVGLLVNLLVAWMLSKGKPNLNVRAALLHVVGDALGSVAALLAGVIIWATGWTPIDPLLSLLIGGVILGSSVRLLQEALHGTLDAVPAGLDLAALGNRLAAAPGVREIHDLHVWPLSAERVALSAHVRVDRLESWPETLATLTRIARAAGIDHVTFQPTATSAAPQVVRFLAGRESSGTARDGKDSGKT